MKKRYFYILLFAVPALMAAAIVATMLFGALAGAMWIFVYGDNPWPPHAEKLLVAVLLLAGGSVWIGLLSLAYAAGRRLEPETGLNGRHVLAALGTTLLLVLLVVAHQRGVGNLGPQPDSVVCADHCRARGFAGSGMPPRDAGAPTCSCYDAQGREALKLPMEAVTAAPAR